MAIDRKRVSDIFQELGARLKQPTTLCLIGSTPGIMLGQDTRQTEDIDVWHPASDYDAGKLAQACEGAGILFDPKGEIKPGAVYLQIVRPGDVVSLPARMELEVIARFGSLTVTMPEPAMIAAAKLTRAADRDIDDVAWLVSHFGLSVADVEQAISSLPRQRDRETASENVVFVRMIGR